MNQVLQSVSKFPRAKSRQNCLESQSFEPQNELSSQGRGDWEPQSTQSCRSCRKGQESRKRKSAYPKGNAMAVPMDPGRMGAEDLISLKYLYPENLSPLNELVMAVCDQMEYEGSMMYDRYPDRVTVDRIVSSICHHQWHGGEECRDEKLKTIVRLMLCHEMSCRRRKKRW